MLWTILKRSLRPYLWMLAGVAVFQLAQSIAALYLPALNADIIDQGIANQDSGYILGVGSVMLGLTLVQIAFTLAAVYCAARLSMSVGRDLRAQVFRQVGTFSEREMTRFGTATLITRCTNDVQQVQMLVLTSCTMLVTAPILSIGGVVMALQQDVVLSWVLVIAVPVLLISVALIVVRMVPLYQKLQTSIDAVNGSMREQLTGIRTIRAFVRERYEADRFAQANNQVFDVSLKSGRLFGLVFPIVQLVLNASSVAVVWFGADRIASGDMQVGALTAFLTYLIQILMAVTMATFVVILLPRASVSAARIGEVLDTTTSLAARADPSTDFTTSGEIVVAKAMFSYPGADEPVLKDISLSAGRGLTAIVGSTGSGKTTLLNLIPRLLDPDSGTVTVDGVEVRAADPEVLWSRIGLVPQISYLLSGTIATNLRFGGEQASDDDLWAALRTAQAAEFVERLPGGLEAPITQGGTNLSGGQRQRIAIARALVKKPEIYLFDDAFSSLDTTTDALLREALTRDFPGSTFIVVAQRISTIEAADQILLLENGEITARGTHEELRRTSRSYAEIVNSQLPAGATA